MRLSESARARGIVRGVRRPSFMPYGRSTGQSIHPVASAVENGTMHTSGKLQFPDVSDAPTAPLSQGRARRIHNHARHELRCANTGVQRN